MKMNIRIKIPYMHYLSVCILTGLPKSNKFSQYFVTLKPFFAVQRSFERYRIRCQFHQRFYVQIFRTNVVLAAFSSYVLASASKFRTKNASVNVDEIDGRIRSQFHQLDFEKFKM